MNQKDIERRQSQKLAEKNNVVDIDGRFAIGGDDAVKKVQKAEASRIYMHKLNQDLGDRSATRKVSSDQEYVNRTGWSGLNIGGSSSGNTNSTAALRTQKEKQHAYKQSLDAQMSATADRHAEQRFKEMEELELIADPPYLEVDRR
jgi:hypothetical protein